MQDAPHITADLVQGVEDRLNAAGVAGVVREVAAWLGEQVGATDPRYEAVLAVLGDRLIYPVGQCEQLGQRQWSREEFGRLLFLWLQGRTAAEIAVELERSESSVRNKLGHEQAKGTIPQRFPPRGGS